MIDGISNNLRQKAARARTTLNNKGTHLRASIIILPFSLAAVTSFVYAWCKFPPASFQCLILLSTLLCLVVVCYCRTWIYRFQAGIPLLALSFGGALFFPMAAATHVWEYHIIDSGIGVGVALGVWAVSGYCLWRLFQPSQDDLWNSVAARFRHNPNHWLVIIIFPLMWAGYGFSLFAFIDTQFDKAGSRIFFPAVVAKAEHLQGWRLHYYVTLSPWPRDYDRSAGPEGPEIPATTFHRLEVGKPACVIQHAGLLWARWYEVDACHAPYAPTLAAS